MVGPDQEPPAPARASAPPRHVFAAIVGTGFSGLCMAIELKKAGIEDLVLLERSTSLGGTWRDNHYPGCACDVPSYLYSYSFEPSTEWSRAFAPHDEIRAYLERCADKYDLRRHIRFGMEMVEASFDEARAIWRLRSRSGEVITANVVVSGIGGLSNPAYPSIRGRDRFQGAQFHSARWDHSVDLAGKRVAVIGTGASAIQFVPQIQPKVKQLHLFQRTPPWILPKPDREFTDREKRAFEKVPGLARAYRTALYWQYEMRGVGFFLDPRVMKLARGMCERFLRKSIKDERLRAKVTPTYLPGCKRVLISNDYYPAIQQPNVEVLTDAIAEIDERGVLTEAGRSVEVDAILYGTGFAVHDYVGPLRITGRGGASLNERWKGGAEAYLGMTISGFPNLFMLVGPNTGLGHNSMVVMIEAQVGYAAQAIRLVRDRGLATVDVRADVERAYNDRIQRRASGTIWSSGCRSWYLNEQGKNTTLWPGSTVEYRARTARFDPESYEIKSAPSAVISRTGASEDAVAL